MISGEPGFRFARSPFPSFAAGGGLVPSDRMKTPDPRRRQAGRIVRALAKLYPDAYCALRHENPLQLLIATILSAQCTDVRVNLVTPALFARYPDAASFANADQAELERMIQSTGFFRNKAKSIIACCKQIDEKHGG